jgi:hypothetical protein
MPSRIPNHRLSVALVWLVAVVASLFLSRWTPDFASGAWRVPGSESGRASILLTNRFGQPTGTETSFVFRGHPQGDPLAQADAARSLLDGIVAKAKGAKVASFDLLEPDFQVGSIVFPDSGAGRSAVLDHDSGSVGTMQWHAVGGAVSDARRGRQLRSQAFGVVPIVALVTGLLLAAALLGLRVAGAAGLATIATVIVSRGALSLVGRLEGIDGDAAAVFAAQLLAALTVTPALVVALARAGTWPVVRGRREPGWLALAAATGLALSRRRRVR